MPHARGARAPGRGAEPIHAMSRRCRTGTCMILLLAESKMNWNWHVCLCRRDMHAVCAHLAEELGIVVERRRVPRR